MAHRNRWFTELKNGDFPWQTVSHNQRVLIDFMVLRNQKWGFYGISCSLIPSP